MAADRSGTDSVAEATTALGFGVADGFGSLGSGWRDLPQHPEGFNCSAAFRRRKASPLGVAASLPSGWRYTLALLVRGSPGVATEPWLASPPVGFRRGAPGSLGLLFRSAGYCRSDCPDRGCDALLNFPSAVRFGFMHGASCQSAYTVFSNPRMSLSGQFEAGIIRRLLFGILS